MDRRSPHLALVLLAASTLGCSQTPSPTSAPTDAHASAREPHAAPEPGPAASPPTCALDRPRASPAAYAHACAYLDAQAADIDEAELARPEGVPADWRALHDVEGSFFAPPDWVVVREGESRFAVAPGTPSMASGIICSVNPAPFEAGLDPAELQAAAHDMLDGQQDGPIAMNSSRRRGADVVELGYTIMGDQWREWLYSDAQGVRAMACIDHSQRDFAGRSDEVDGILASLMPASASAEPPSEACQADNFVVFPGPIEAINADLVPLIVAPEQAEFVAIAEVEHFTQCSFWARLLPLDGSEPLDAIIVGYEPLAPREAGWAPARLTLATRGAAYTDWAPEPGRPPSLPTDVVVIEPAVADSFAELAVLAPERPAGLDAPGQVVAALNLWGADDEADLVFVREQRGDEVCLVSYLATGPSGWTAQRDSCAALEPPAPPAEPDRPNPPPKRKRPPPP